MHKVMFWPLRLKRMFSVHLLDNLCGEKMMEKKGRGKIWLKVEDVAVWAKV